VKREVSDLLHDGWHCKDSKSEEHKELLVEESLSEDEIEDIIKRA